MLNKLKVKLPSRYEHTTAGETRTTPEHAQKYTKVRRGLGKKEEEGGQREWEKNEGGHWCGRGYDHNALDSPMKMTKLLHHGSFFHCPLRKEDYFDFCCLQFQRFSP